MALFLLHLKSGFLNSSTMDIWGQDNSSGGACPVHCRIPGFCQLDASITTTPSSDSQNVSRLYLVFPEGKIMLVKNQCVKRTTTHMRLQSIFALTGSI